MMTPREKKNVYKTYDDIADWYEAQRAYDMCEASYLENALSHLPDSPDVLDLGCGAAKPLATYLVSKGCQVTGVDGSLKMLEKAQENCPEGTFMQGDMRTVSFEKKFHLVIAWHSFFHLPPEDQKEMFGQFKKLILPGGILIFTAGPREDEVWSENGGQLLYHASLDPQTYRSLLKESGFEVLNYQEEDPKCGKATVWMAQQKGDG